MTGLRVRPAGAEERMTVTQISEAAKSRYRIYVDGQFAFVIYKGELRRFQIEEGKEISEELYHSIKNEILPKRAKLRSMKLLQSKDYTRKQLEDKLRQGEYPQECIDETIRYVESYGYIDDRKYARNYIEYHIQDRSRRRIETDLMAKGIAKDVIRDVFDGLAGEGVEQDENRMVSLLLKKKNYSAESATDTERQKLYGYLYRKGFSPDVICRAFS